MVIIGYITSVLIGLSLGLIGGGGSILTVPILVYFFHTEPVLATTYSLFVVGITSLAGAISHYKQQNVNVKIAVIFGLPSLIAVFIMRKWIMPTVPANIFQLGNFELTKGILLMLVFAVLMLLAATSMIRQKPVVKTAISHNYVKLISQSIFVGVITGFVGVGGGFLIIPSLVLFAGLPMKKAVGTSLLIMTVSSLIGVLGDLSGNIVLDYHFLALFSALAIAGTIFGSYFSARISDLKLKPTFGWFVLAMGVFVLVSTILK